MVEAKRLRVKEISPEATMEKLERKENILLIDTREDHEWERGHVAGARHLGRGVLERDIEKAIPDKDREIVLYCGGGFRSALAADNLQRMGYRHVYSLAGGWKAWVGAGGPTE